jgi:hypothetical protein
MVSEDHSRKSARQAAKSPDTQRAAYAPLADHFAVYDRTPGTPAPQAVLLLEDGSVAVFRGKPDDAMRRTARIGPVYRSAQGRLVVPTGRILVRFRDGVAAESRRRDIEAAGFEVEEILPYATQAAWVRGKGTDIAGSLSRIGSLRGLADVEHVEPEWLSQAARRTDSAGKSRAS